MRDFPPADYQFQIKSFSLLSKLVEKRFESGDFYSSGLTWKLCLYPNENGKGHVSLYLAISNTHTLFYEGNVDVNFKLSVYDQLRHKYLTIEDANRRASNFNQLKTECGFAIGEYKGYMFVPEDFFMRATA
ncbi:unnamed protein product [Ilex paraguariensis]|uniref:MATH domain-containing protein n=1 Tax=Ilex paraguariensis TaxID=185542 RepID=A0ABC8S7X1_9AQUA